MTPLAFSGAVAAGLLAACASPAAPATQEAPPVSETPPFTVGLGSDPETGAGILDGGIWTVIRLNGAEIPSDRAPTLAFRGHGVTGSTGCNRYFGQVSVVESGISFAPMGVSRRACAPEIMNLENDFMAALRSVDGYVLHSEDRLDLSRGEDIRIEARRAR